MYRNNKNASIQRYQINRHNCISFILSVHACCRPLTSDESKNKVKSERQGEGMSMTETWTTEKTKQQRKMKRFAASCHHRTDAVFNLFFGWIKKNLTHRNTTLTTQMYVHVCCMHNSPLCAHHLNWNEMILRWWFFATWKRIEKKCHSHLLCFGKRLCAVF